MDGITARAPSDVIIPGQLAAGMHACMLIAMPVVTDIFYNSNESKLLNNPKYFVVPTLGVWCAQASYPGYYYVGP